MGMNCCEDLKEIMHVRCGPHLSSWPQFSSVKWGWQKHFPYRVLRVKGNSAPHSPISPEGGHTQSKIAVDLVIMWFSSFQMNKTCVNICVLCTDRVPCTNAPLVFKLEFLCLVKLKENSGQILWWSADPQCGSVVWLNLLKNDTFTEMGKLCQALSMRVWRPHDWVMIPRGGEKSWIKSQFPKGILTCSLTSILPLPPSTGPTH